MTRNFRNLNRKQKKIANFNDQCADKVVTVTETDINTETDTMAEVSNSIGVSV